MTWNNIILIVYTAVNDETITLEKLVIFGEQCQNEDRLRVIQQEHNFN